MKIIRLDEKAPAFASSRLSVSSPASQGTVNAVMLPTSMRALAIASGQRWRRASVRSNRSA